jgi:hypothetical protein
MRKKERQREKEKERESEIDIERGGESGEHNSKLS